MNGRHLFIIASLTLISSLTLANAQTRQDPVPPGDRDQAVPEERAYYPNLPADSLSVPPTLTLPAGTLIQVRTAQTLSSDVNRQGDSFTTVLEQPLVVQGWVVARRGQTVLGRVVDAQKAGRNKNDSQLAIELNELLLVDGQQLPIRTQMTQIVGGKSNSQTLAKVATVGTTTGIGAAIGGAVGGGDGAIIGTVIGATAGLAGVMSTRGQPTEIYAETELAFRLEAPVTIFTGQSQQAFVPVIPDDYSQRPARNPDRYPVAGNNAPPPVYYAPYGYGAYPLPYLYYGFYGYYGPRYYAVPRVYVRPGHRGRW
jgi:hypothetical protein